MLTILALSAVSTAYGQSFAVPTVLDFADAFETNPVTGAAYANATINAFSGTGGWVTQYTADTWSRPWPGLTGGYLHANSDVRSASNGWGFNNPQDNAIVQTANVCGPAKNKPCAWGTSPWGAYQLETDYASGDNDAIGVVFGWVDAR